MKIILIIMIFYMTKVSALVESQKIIPEFDPINFHQKNNITGRYIDGGEFARNVSLGSGIAVISHAHSELFLNEVDGEKTVDIYKKNVFGSWEIFQKLSSSVTDDDDGFGDNIAISNNNKNTILVSDRGTTTDDGRFNVPLIFIFEKNNLGEWVQIQKIHPAIGETNWYDPRFLNRKLPMAIYGDTLVIGSLGEEYKGDRLGAILIYKKNNQGNWEKHQVIYGPGGDTDFGSSIDIYNEKIIVSDPHDSTHGNRSGAVYFYEKVGNYWQQSQIIYPDDSSEYQYFGESISLSNENIIVGDSGMNKYLPHQMTYASATNGSVYVFSLYKENLSWYQSQKIVAPESFSGDSFGNQVDLSENAAVFSAPSPYLISNNAVIGFDTGSAFLYLKGEDDTWRLESVLSPSDPFGACQFGPTCSSRNGFGNVVAIHGGDIVIGMERWSKKTNEIDSDGRYLYIPFYGAAYFYNSEQLMTDIPTISNNFYFSLAILLVFLFTLRVKNINKIS